MVEETLSSVTPKINVPSKPNNLSQGAGERQATASKNANTRAAAKPVDRQQKLKVHLLIGFVMAGMAVLGYTFLGSGASASAAGAANHQLINVSPNGGIPSNQLRLCKCQPCLAAPWRAIWPPCTQKWKRLRVR